MNIQGTLSDKRELSFDVPQGFCTILSSVSDIIQHFGFLLHHKNANDTQLNIAIKEKNY